MSRRVESPLAQARTAALIAAGLVAMIVPTQAGAALAKRGALQSPIYEKLTEGAGPETNDVHERRLSRQGKALLCPVTLDSGAAAAADTQDTGMLKSSVSMTGYAPKGPIDPAAKSLFNASKSIGSEDGEEKVLKAAKNVNAMPLPLMESAEETQKKIDTILDAEKVQLADLWESTLTRSPDIQFVVQKLMPTSNPGHASTIMMRMLSSAIFGAMGAVNMMAPNAGVYAANNMGTSMIMNVLQLQESKQAQKAHLTQTESIMLYNMVRNTADRLVEAYRNYKKEMAVMAKSLTDLQDLQNMVTEARSGQDAAKQVEMEYTIRKAQRDVEAATEDVKKYRQGLVDLAGVEAVAKLDKQLDEEQARLDQRAPAPGNNQQTAAAPGTQS